MNVAGIPLLNALGAQMRWLDARQSVLSQNVANADTPGFQAKDLKPADFASMLKTGTAMQSPMLLTTDPSHLAGAATSQQNFSQVTAPDTEANPTGNTVSLEEEMIKVSETQAQYQAATNLYAKSMAMLRRAIGAG